MKNFGFVLKDLTQRYVARFETHAREFSLTLIQCKVLVSLENNEGVSQAKLAELAEIEPMMMVRLLDRMESDKLLERRPDPNDRRARRLYLTKKAKPLLEVIWRLAETTRSEAFAGVNKSDRDTFIDVLERVHANVCALDKQSADQRPELPAAKRTRRPRTASPRAIRQAN